MFSNFVLWADFRGHVSAQVVVSSVSSKKLSLFCMEFDQDENRAKKEIHKRIQAHVHLNKNMNRLMIPFLFKERLERHAN